MKKLILEKVTKIYEMGKNNDVAALEDVSLAVNEGEFIAVIGPSGSGKSTFLSIAGALLKPTTGVVIIDGQEISNLSDKELSRVRLHKVGFILQASNLIPYLTTLDQLLLVKDIAGKVKAEHRQKATSLLEDMGLAKRLKHYPNTLSGGERQRIAIARAFMNDPEIILADEPTANLDTKRGYEVVELLANQAKKYNKVAILVTHDERMVSHCNRIIHITDGKLT